MAEIDRLELIRRLERLSLRLGRAWEEVADVTTEIDRVLDEIAAPLLADKSQGEQDAFWEARAEEALAAERRDDA